MQCLMEHGVKLHLPYDVCIEDGAMQCVIEHAVQRQMPYVMCLDNGLYGA